MANWKTREPINGEREALVDSDDGRTGFADVVYRDGRGRLSGSVYEVFEWCDGPPEKSVIDSAPTFN